MRLIAASALVAVTLMLVPLAQGRTGASLTLNVNWDVNGVITVTLPDGTPVGSTGSTPTVIPAGYYTVVESGPGGCTYSPLFELKGPGLNINDDLTGGEITTYSYSAYFLPNSTYTWRNTAIPPVVHTFTTSADIVGSTPAKAGSSGATSSTRPTSEDIVGSAILPFRGTLTGAVSAAGRLTIAFKGKSVSRLTAGRYTLTVTDRSATGGFILKKGNHAPVGITTVAFLGKRSASVDLTAGKWTFAPLLGKKTYSIVVS